MKLYYMPASCSLAAHVALREAALPFTLARYEMKSAVLEDGAPLTSVNEKGFVPVLELDSGDRLTEVAVVLQYIADQKPELQLAPPAGTMERYRLQEWLNYIATEVHKSYWPLFHGGTEVENEKAKDKLARNFTWVEAKLGARPFLVGDRFTVADAYLYVTLNWTKPAGIDLNRWPGLFAYRARIKDRPAVVAAMEAEGLLKRR